MISRRLTPSPDWFIPALLLLLYAPLLVHWVDGWLNKSVSIQHEYFSHGLLGLPFAAYIVWEKRTLWRRLEAQCHPLGLGLLLVASGMYATGLTDWMSLSLPLMLAGVCLTLKGRPGLRLQAMPLLLVALATPTQLPYLIEPYILPLQQFIAAVAGFLLTHTGVSVTVEQIYLYVNDQAVEVAPHCAGLKMLFTSLYVGLMLIYWTGAYTSKLWVGLFFGGTVAISVVGNIIRNALLSYFHGMGYNDLFHWLHESWGGDVYSGLMLLLLILWLRILRRYVPPTFSLNRQAPASV